MRLLRTAAILVLMYAFPLMSGQEIAIGDTVSLLALGDSYTIGESVQTCERWPHQFAEELRNLGIKTVDPLYIARTGWTTEELLAGINDPGNEALDCNLVSILVGVNNQYRGLAVEIYEPELRRIIDFALEKVDQDTSRVFILSIPDYAFTPFGKGKNSISRGIDAYNAINKAVAAAYGISYVDITPISRKGLDHPSLVADDGLHPSEVQYHQWVQQILPQLSIEH